MVRISQYIRINQMFHKIRGNDKVLKTENGENSYNQVFLRQQKKHIFVWNYQEKVKIEVKRCVKRLISSPKSQIIVLTFHVEKENNKVSLIAEKKTEKRN